MLQSFTEMGRYFELDEVESTVNMAQSSGMTKITNAFGILGLVKFFNGYYLIILKSRQKVGSLRGGSIYKIVSTEMIYLCKRVRHVIFCKLKMSTFFICVEPGPYAILVSDPTREAGAKVL